MTAKMKPEEHPHRNSTTRIVSWCGIATGSFFFLGILGIGLYLYFIKGVPSMKEAESQHKLSMAYFQDTLVAGLLIPEVTSRIREADALTLRFDNSLRTDIQAEVYDHDGTLLHSQVLKKGSKSMELSIAGWDLSEQYQVKFSASGKAKDYWLSIPH